MTPSNDNRLVTLISGEQEDPVKLTLSPEAAKGSQLLATTLSLGEDDDEDEDNNNNMTSSNFEDLTLEKITGPVLKTVVEFLEHYAVEPSQEVPSPLPAETLEECVKQEWYLTFVKNLDRNQVFEILSAANFMDMKPLMDLVILRITFDICGKKPEEIKEYLAMAERGQGGGEEAAAPSAAETAAD